MAEADKPSSSFSLSNLKQSTEQLWTDSVSKATNKVHDVVDQGISAVSSVVRTTTATVQQEGSKALEQAQDVVGVGVAHYKQTEETAISKLRVGVSWVLDHQTESTAAAVVLAAILLPGPRRFLYRRTLGKLRSEEAMFKSAEIRATSLAEKLETQNQDIVKLQERVAQAEAEYMRGVRNLKAAASDLQSLSSQVRSSEKGARALVQDLRQLPSKAALQLRADVAQAATVAANQRTILEKMLVTLAKRGVA